MSMSSEDLPAEDRFAWWREQMSEDTAPMVVSTPHVGDFRFTVTLAELGPVRLAVLTFPEVRAMRTPTLIRRSDPERYGLNLITGGSLWHEQRDRDCLLRTGDLLLHDISLPNDARAMPSAGSGSMLMLHFPKSALPLRPERLGRLLAHRMPGDTGMNAVLVSYLTRLASVVERSEVSEPEMERLGGIALDLAAATLAAQIDAEDRLTPETRGQALLHRIEAFIDHNLADPDLTPTTIADHHHISLAYLHKLFQPRELTAAASIRHRRLERCRTDLADPRLNSHPVHTIGARWGFRTPADFSRAFRTAYGQPPGEYRRQALDAGHMAARPIKIESVSASADASETS